MPEPLRSTAFRAKAFRFALAATLALFLCCGTLVSAEDSNLVVSTKSGNVRGVARGSSGAEFLGVPYAQPPTGERRWREPVPV
jgi:para-nitrobenzyl esterase